MNRVWRIVRVLAHLRLLAYLAAFGSFLVWTGAAFGHEVRPVYLQVTESDAGTFEVLLKTPMRGDLRLALDVEFSGKVEITTSARAACSRIA